MASTKVKSNGKTITYVALLRGINVGGRNSLPMKSLKELCESLGCENVKTYIQSGNVVFQAKSQSKSLAKRLGASVLDAHGFEPSVMLFEASAVLEIIANNPFPTDDGKLLHFFFLNEIPISPDLEKLEAVRQPPEVYALKDSVLYLYAPDGVSRSKLFEKVEKSLGVPATARNWNTVNKLSQMVNG